MNVMKHLHQVNQPSASSSIQNLLGDEIPSSLRSIIDAPIELYVRGRLDQSMGYVGVIGTRKPSEAALRATRLMAQVLADRGHGLVSGLAMGIDACAHQAALCHQGHTVAVLPCGINRVYPDVHSGLAQDILLGDGALVSEESPQFKQTKKSFVQRNRLITGLSQALVFVEGEEQSGSIHAARYALAQGKHLILPELKQLSSGARAILRWAIHRRNKHRIHLVHSTKSFRKVLRHIMR